MKTYETAVSKQLELLEGGIIEMKSQPAKRVNIVSLKMVKESSLLYKERRIQSSEDAYKLLKQFLGNVDRGYLVVVAFDIKNQPCNLNICHIGSLNVAIVHLKDIMKFAALANIAFLIVGHSHQSRDPSPSREDVGSIKAIFVGREIRYRDH